jgi:hypothetical protein
MPKHPLGEVFGYPPNNFSVEAERYRLNRLCPFNNKVPNCTKDKAKDPLGVCSVLEEDKVVVTCPIRFREKLMQQHFSFRPKQCGLRLPKFAYLTSTATLPAI